jgi:TonB family protein
MAVERTGIFYLQPGAPAGTSAFPADLRARMASRLEGRFVMLFAGLLFVIGGLVFALSLRKTTDVISDKQIMRIQERYASIVLNQPKPKVEEKPKAGPTGTQQTADKGEKPKVDRSKESVADRTKRFQATREDRARTLAKIGKEVQSAGIFAAITAASGSGGRSAGGGGMTDLLGATDVMNGLANVTASGGGGFVSKNNVDVGSLGNGPRGNRTSGVGIEVAAVGKAGSQQIASAGDVNMSSEPATVSDESAVKGGLACINSVITRERSRVKRVYETWLKRDPKLAGRIKVKFTILPTGAVSNASVMQSTTGNSAFDENVIRYIARWDFAQCAPGTAIEVEVPFVFEGQGEG